MKILYCERPLGNISLQAPVSLLTDSSLSRNNRPLFVPEHHSQWIMTIAPAFRISRLGKCVAPKFANRYYDAVTMVARLRPASDCMTISSATDTAFDSSIVIGEFAPIDKENTLNLDLSGNIERTVTIDMSRFDELLAWLTSYFMIKHGDVIIPGDLPDILPVNLDTHMSIMLDQKFCLDFKIK